MDEKIIQKVSKIIEEWNPLGENANSIKDLNGYRTEAIDIMFAYQLGYFGKIEKIVKDVLKQAFDIKGDPQKTAETAHKIESILKRNK